MIKKLMLICTALAWTGASTVAFAQENPYVGENPHAKSANVHRYHRAAHAHKTSALHHKAMAAGQASIKSHPHYGTAPMTHHAKKYHPQ